MRRSNKSAKVPNVKLRPAAPLARRSSPQSFRLHDSDDISDQDVTQADRCYRPFRNVVLCATGISDKTTVFKQALELGALSLNDLTDRVTHLLATRSGSAKYKCALENKIPIMHPSWITDSHDIWLRGDEFDLEESILSHRLPIFSGVVLCVSGIDDIERRGEINRVMTQQGGTYVKQIERPVRVTHLLCASGPEYAQTEKMRYAEKFNQRGEANISLVWEEWFWDSLRFGGRFDEDLYKVSNPPPPRRATPEPTPPPQSSSPEDDRRTSSSSQPPRPSAFKPLDHTDLLAGDDEEVASVKRVPEITLQIWESLLKPRGFEIQEGRLVRSPSKSQSRDGQDLASRSRAASPTRTKSERLANAVKTQAGIAVSAGPTSALSTFKRAQSFAPVLNAAPTARQPFSRAPTAGPSSSFLARPGGGTDKGKEKAKGTTSTDLFAGLTFRMLGEARSASVRTALEDSGGRLVPDEGDEEADYVIVRLVSGGIFYREEVEEAERAKYRTECWLERCIFDERICGPDEHVAFTPLKTDIPIAGAGAVNLSFSGLDQSEACWIRRLLRALGVNLAPNFSRRSTHLLCPSGTGVKADKARQWGVPIVSMEWLAEMVRSGAIPPITGYVVADDSTEVPLLNPLPTSEIDAVTAVNKYPEMPEVHNEPEVPNLVNVPEVFKADYKGKGKERATEHTLTDVTNDSPANAPLLLEHADYPLPSPPPNIDFEPTHGSLAVEQEDDEPFGQPSGLLGTAPSSLALSYATPPLSRRATTDEPNPVLSPGGAPDELGIRPSSAKPSSIDLPSQCERVPSSESPSPLKLLPHIDGHETPEKIRPAPSRELRKSFTTLLGKRPSSEDDGPDPAHAEQSRMSKRARPPSKQNLVFEKDAAPAKANASPSPPGAYAGFAPADGDTSFLDAELAERSMLVTYADPGQLDEKQQLMQLLVDQKREIWDVDSELPVPAAVARPGAKGPNKGRAAVGRRGTRVAGV